MVCWSVETKVSKDKESVVMIRLVTVGIE